MAKSERLPPIHPGEILCEDFMKPLGISMNQLALDLRVPVTRIAEIVHQRRGVTPDTALRLGRYFNTSAPNQATIWKWRRTNCSAPLSAMCVLEWPNPSQAKLAWLGAPAYGDRH